MTFEELFTTLYLIKACVNSYLLIPLSTDPNDLSGPNDFLGRFLCNRNIQNKTIFACCVWIEKKTI